MNLLLTEENRVIVTQKNNYIMLQEHLNNSLHWVYIGVAFFAVISLLTYITDSTWKGVTP